MNEDYTNNDYFNSQTNTENQSNTEPVASEPYRYRYENGEKKEQTTTSGYSTYNYGPTSYSYERTASTVTGEAPVKKKKRPVIKLLAWLAGAACFGIIAGAAFLGTSYVASEVFGIQIMQKQNAGTDDSNDVTSADNNSIGTGIPTNITLGVTSTIEGVENPAENVVVQVVEQNMAATVAVNSTLIESTYFWGQTYQEEVPVSGSGFIVGKNDTELLIATNNHVINNATKIEVTFIDDSKLEAIVKGTDASADLAIIAVQLDSISIDTLGAIRVATLGDSDAVRLGEMAIAIGNALGYGQSVTVGYISAKDRTVSIEGNEMVLLQTDAAINGGNSGGPLFNTRGEVIGINSAKYADTSVEGMCFAIPISRAIPILNELMTREILAEEDKGFLGIGAKDVTQDIASFYGWPIGAYITKVYEGSPAELSNIYVGDIVTGVNNVKITTASDLVSAVSSYRYGTTIELTVQRILNGKYEEIKINATLAKKADVEAAAEAAEQKKNLMEENPDNSDKSKRPR